MIAAIENKINNPSINLSEEHLWSRYGSEKDGGFMSHTVEAAKSFITTEKYWPYSSTVRGKKAPFRGFDVVSQVWTIVISK